MCPFLWWLQRPKVKSQIEFATMPDQLAHNVPVAFIDSQFKSHYELSNCIHAVLAELTETLHTFWRIDQALIK